MKKEQQQKTLLEVVKQDNTKEVLKAFQKIDINNYNNGKTSNNVREYLQILLYDCWITQTEEEEEKQASVSLSHDVVKLLFNQAPYIKGLKSLNIDFNKTSKEVSICFMMSRPYGDYKDGLELNGLKFRKEKTKAEQEIRTSEQQEALAECFSILSSVGLGHMIGQ